MNKQDAAFEYVQKNPPEMLEDIGPYQLEPGVTVVPHCLRCKKRSFYDRPTWALYKEAHRLRLGVCPRCYLQIALRGTLGGRRAVEELIYMATPAQLQDAELENFRDYSDHLTDVYNRVLRWCQAARRGEPCGSVLLYSEPGRWGTGCGNGKSRLLWSIFKQMVRHGSELKPIMAGIPLEWLDQHGVRPPCFACDLKTVLFDPFTNGGFTLDKVDLSPFSPLTLNIPNPPVVYSIDDIVLKIVAPVPILLLDDVGRDRPEGMAAKLYEQLLDMRAANNLPTFVTSNYGPKRLGRQIGDRAVSRLLRTDCTVIEVRAPDYSLVRDRVVRA